MASDQHHHPLRRQSNIYRHESSEYCIKVTGSPSVVPNTVVFHRGRQFYIRIKFKVYENNKYYINHVRDDDGDGVWILDTVSDRTRFHDSRVYVGTYEKLLYSWPRESVLSDLFYEAINDDVPDDFVRKILNQFAYARNSLDFTHYTILVDILKSNIFLQWRLHQAVPTASSSRQLQQAVPPNRSINLSVRPAITIDDDDQKSSSNDCLCVICLGDLLSVDCRRELPCKHLFHKGCINKWLETKRVCPLCRFQV